MSRSSVKQPRHLQRSSNQRHEQTHKAAHYCERDQGYCHWRESGGSVGEHVYIHIAFGLLLRSLVTIASPTVFTRERHTNTYEKSFFSF
jgi:hypothetical protein